MLLKWETAIGPEENALEPLEVQVEGRKRMPVEAFLNGQRLNDNEALGETE
jgi:hypothetical protein